MININDKWGNKYEIHNYDHYITYYIYTKKRGDLRYKSNIINESNILFSNNTNMMKNCSAA